MLQVAPVHGIGSFDLLLELVEYETPENYESQRNSA